MSGVNCTSQDKHSNMQLAELVEEIGDAGGKKL